MKKLIKKILRVLRPQNTRDWEDTNLILSAQAIMLSENWRSTPDFANPFWIQKKEFRVYSQFGDDGIIHKIPKTNISDGFQETGFRESRDKQGLLTYSDTDKEITQMSGMPVVDISTNKIVKL